MGQITESSGEKDGKSCLTEFSGVWAYNPRQGKNRTIRTAATNTDEGLREALPRKQRDSAVMCSRGSQKPFSLGATRNGEFREI
jgi:hypothetical protein